MEICDRKAYCGHPESDHVDGRCQRCPCGRVSAAGREMLGKSIGKKLKDANLDAHEINHRSDLNAARMIRDRLAIEHGSVSADDVRRVFEQHRPGAWGPWAGSLFRGGEYEPTGEFIPSEYATNHGAVIRVWRRKR